MISKLNLHILLNGSNFCTPDVPPYVSGSLPPSPADSGVSDVDSSSSGHTSTDELKARLQPSIHSPVGNIFSRHPLSWSSPSHHSQRPPNNHMSQPFYQHFPTSKYLYRHIVYSQALYLINLKLMIDLLILSRLFEIKIKIETGPSAFASFKYFFIFLTTSLCFD